MTDAPLISAITPSHNQGPFLERCLASVRNQHYPNCEHIVYDNCSTDQTLAILRRHPEVAWVSEPDHGQSHALNKALRRARGEIIAWINADDAYEPGAFAAAARELRSGTGVMAIAGRVHIVDPHDRILRTLAPNVATLPDLVEFWRAGFCLDQCGVLFRREALAAIGGLDEQLHYAMDYDLFLRMAERAPLKLVDDVLARFTLHPHSKTGRLGRTHLLIAERQRVSQRYWGPPGSPAYRARQRACRRHLRTHFAGAVVHVYQRHGVLDWAALGRLARHSPAALLNRHLLGVLAECCLRRHPRRDREGAHL